MEKNEYIKPPKLSTSFSQSGKNTQKRFDNILGSNKGKISAIIIAVIVILCLAISMFFYFNNEKIDEETVNAIVKDSYLDILINMQNYSKDNIDKQKMLEAGMRIARELELVQQDVREYVLEEDISKILSQLTGVDMNEPIIINEFKYYYPYNVENKCYEIIPMGTDWIHLDKIKSIKKKGDIYILDCSAKNYIGELNGYEYIDYIDSVKIELQYMKNNELVKYQINSITSTQRLELPENAQNVDYDKVVESNIIEAKSKEYMMQQYNMENVTPLSFTLVYPEHELKAYTVYLEQYIDIKEKLCWSIQYDTSELLGPITIYYDAYTADLLGIGLRQ